MMSCAVHSPPPAGDILLNVNGVDLTGVTRGEAVANLKNTTSPVVLKVLEMRPPEESLQECPLPPCLTPSPTDSTKSMLPNDDYSPLWVSWLQLPRWAFLNPLHIHFSILPPTCSVPSIIDTPTLVPLTSARWCQVTFWQSQLGENTHYTFTALMWVQLSFRTSTPILPYEFIFTTITSEIKMCSSWNSIFQLIMSHN